MSAGSALALLVVSALLAVAAVGCAASSGTEAREDGPVKWRSPDLIRLANQDLTEEDVLGPPGSTPMEDYIMDETDGMIFKLRPQAWQGIEPTVSRLLAGSAPEQLAAFVGARLKLDLEFEHLDGSRALYVAFTPRSHHPWGACVSAGLPCSLFGEPSPAWGRLLLPATDVKGLQKEIRERVAYPERFRFVRHDDYVRVEFVLGPEELTGAVREKLDRRADYWPDVRGVRLTPAKETVLDHQGVAAAYVNLEDASDIGSYLLSLKWHRAYESAPRSEKMDVALQGALASFELVEGRLPEEFRFEDAAFTIDGDGEAVWMDVVQTRSRVGREVLQETGDGAVNVAAALGVGQALRHSPWPLSQRAATALQGMVVGLNQVVGVKHRPVSRRGWAALRYQYGGQEVEGPRVSAGQNVNLRQPKGDCLQQRTDGVMEPIVSGALERTERQEWLSDRLTSEAGAFDQAVIQCGVPGRWAEERVGWAIGAFDTWRALLAWRTGRTEWSRRLLSRACEDGLTWACMAPTDQWPWRTAQQARALR